MTVSGCRPLVGITDFEDSGITVVVNGRALAIKSKAVFSFDFHMFKSVIQRVLQRPIPSTTLDKLLDGSPAMWISDRTSSLSLSVQIVQMPAEPAAEKK
jgi:hypothetical protein